MKVLNIDTPTGKISVRITEVKFPEDESVITVYRARASYNGIKYDVGGTTETEAYLKIATMILSDPNQT